MTLSLSNHNDSANVNPMWLFLWVVFVLVAVGFFLWSYHAIYEQKRGWKKFADKYGMQFFGGATMQSPSMSGLIGDYQFNFYPQISENAQGQKATKNVIEAFLNDIPDTLCVVASQGFADFVTVLDLPEPFQIENENWPKNILARTFEDQAPEIWFNASPSRIPTIKKMTKMPFDNAFVADGNQAFIAIRTNNSLKKSEQLEKITKAMALLCKALEDEKTQS